MLKRIKIFVDACMTILLISLFPTAKISPSLHIFLGFVLILVLIIHLLLNGKWLIDSIKKMFCGKLNQKARHMFMLVVGLIVAYSICNYTGIAIYRSDLYFSGKVFLGRLEHSIQMLYALHRISAVACVILTVLHVKVHWSYLKSIIRGKKRQINE